MISKQGLSAVSLSAALISSMFVAAPAASTELKFASFVGGGHVMNRTVFEPWAKEVAALSKGDLTIKMYYGGALGKGGTKQFKRAVDGVADISWGLQGYTANLFRKTTLIEFTGIGATPVDATRRMWKVFDEHLAPEYDRVKVIAIWALDAPIIHTRPKAVKRVDDLQGLKIRTPSQYQAWLIGALGATPVPMPAGKIYNSLDRGVIDGVLISPSAINNFKLDEVTRYHAAGIDWGRSPFFAVMNKQSYEALPKVQRDIIDKTSGLALSVKASQVYTQDGIKGRNKLKADKDRTYVELPADEVTKAAGLLDRAEQDIIARVKKEGIDLMPALKALRGAGS